MYGEPSNTCAGLLVATCLFLGFYAQYPETMKMVVLICGITWFIGKLIQRWN